MFAEIKSLSLLDKFKEKYDQKEGILGTERVHMKLEYQQIAVSVNF